MKITEKFINSNIVVLLLTFLFGALLALLYLPLVKEFMPEGETLCLNIISVIVFIASILAASYPGYVLLPCVTVLLGAVTAMELDSIRLELMAGSAIWIHAAWIAVLVPLHFVICNWGMNFSVYLREAVRAYEQDPAAACTVAYLIILFGAVVFSATKVLMFI